MLHAGRRERMRQRFIQDQGKGFADHEILELLLYYAIPQKDTNALAHELIQHFSSLDAVLEADYEDLIKIDGIGHNTAVLIRLILPLYSQYIKCKLGDKCVLKTQEQLYQYYLWLLHHEKNEHFFIICLDADYRVVGKALVAAGTLREVKAYPRNIIAAALKFHTSYVVLCHNHSSSSCQPSPQDEETTIQIDKLLSALDMQLLDHIIVAAPYVYSMKHRITKQYSLKEFS